MATGQVGNKVGERQGVPVEKKSRPRSATAKRGCMEVWSDTVFGDGFSPAGALPSLVSYMVFASSADLA